MIPNLLAGDHFRNSMQGAFSRSMGGSRVLGTLIAGRAIEYNTHHSLAVASSIVAVGYRPAAHQSSH